jgi:hypothetical protein
MGGGGFKVPSGSTLDAVGVIIVDDTVVPKGWVTPKSG